MCGRLHRPLALDMQAAGLESILGSADLEGIGRPARFWGLYRPGFQLRPVGAPRQIV